MKNKADWLLILRGIACLAVVIWHVGPPKYYLMISGHNLSWLTYPSGIVAVWIFFILTGYLMGKVFITGKYLLTFSGIKKFYINRIKKVVPLYYLNIFILAIFIHPDFLKLKFDTFIKLLTFRANNFWPIMDFNANLWTISTLVQFYIAVPLVYFIFRRFLSKSIYFKYVIGLLIILGGLGIRFLIASFYHVYDAETYTIFIYTNLIANIDFFLFGFFLNILIYNFVNYLPKLPKNYCQIKKIIPFSLALSILFLIFYSNYNSTFLFSQYSPYNLAVLYILPILTIIIIGALIIYIEYNNYRSNYYQTRKRLSFANILNNPIRVMEILGILSLGIYIWQRPVIDIFHLSTNYQDSWISFLQKFSKTFLITFGIAGICHVFIEKQFLSGKNKTAKQY